MKKASLIFLIVSGILFQYGCSNKKETPKESRLAVELNTVFGERSKAEEPGFAVLAAHNGKIVYKNAFGSADLESKTPLTADMVFNAAVLTRQFTAIAIMQLVEQGKMLVQDPISKFIPDYPAPGASITIEQLLTETSGIKDYSKISAATAALVQKELTPLELIGLIGQEPLNFVPGTAWENSNSGYILLGYIIAKVSGETYEQYVEKNIFKPAGMQNSFFGDSSETTDKLAKAYIKGANGFEMVSRGVAAENAASGLNLTLDDYLNFYNALNDLKLISKSSLEQTRTSCKLADGKEIPYGYGSEVTKFEGKKLYSQSGYEKGFFCSQFYLPYQDIQVLVLSNSDLDNKKYFAINVYLKVITDINNSLAFTDSKGMRIEFYHFLFDDVVVPQGGIIPEGEKTSVFVNGHLTTVHYTTDGTEPTIDSPKYNQKIELTKACTLTVKNIPAINPEVEKSASYVFKEGKALEPLANVGDLKPGLKFSYYPGNFDKLPDFDKLVAKSSGIADVPDLSMALDPDTFAIKFDGYLSIEKDGLYNLYTISDDGSQLYLNDELIVDSDGLHGNFPKVYVLPLKKGYYALKVLYFEKTGHEILQAGYWTEGTEPRPFAKEILFHKE
jgi:CubicO group peptidase (beta-lactamase class C family)